MCRPRSARGRPTKGPCSISTSSRTPIGIASGISPTSSSGCGSWRSIDRLLDLLDARARVQALPPRRPDDRARGLSRDPARAGAAAAARDRVGPNPRSARGTSCRTSFWSAASRSSGTSRGAIASHASSARRCRSAICRICSATSAQMPQIWRQFGLDNTILWRGFGGRSAEYWWQAPDGSRVLMMHLPPEGYCNATRLVFDPDAMMARAAEAVDYERAPHGGRTGAADERRRPRRAAARDSRSGRRDCRRFPASAQRHSTLPGYVDAVRRAVSAQQAGRSRPSRRAARRRGLRQPAARRPLRARLPQAARTRACRRCSSRAPSRWRMLRVAARRPLSGRRTAARVEDAAAEPSARQHLRLQHRRRCTKRT